MMSELTAFNTPPPSVQQVPTPSPKCKSHAPSLLTHMPLHGNPSRTSLIWPLRSSRFSPAERVAQQKTIIPVSRHQVRSPGQTSNPLGVYFVWLADEWFLIAGQELPPESEYEDHPQIDNGGFHLS